MRRYIFGAFLVLLFAGAAKAEVCQNLNTCGQIVYAAPRVSNSVPTVTTSGTGVTGTILGHDQDGSIQVATGASAPAAGSTIIAITFSTTWAVGTTGTAPYCEIYPANSVTVALAIGAWPYVTATSTTMTLTAGGTGLGTTATYLWNYHCGL